MSGQKLKVLYVGGYSRCGSTILANVLGEVDGLFSAGELMFLWERMSQPTGLCGCGAHVCACPIWSRVIRTAFGAAENVNCDAMNEALTREWTSANILRSLWLPGGREKLAERLREYLSNLERLYSAISIELPGTTIVDSSKNPGYLYFLSMVRAVDIYVVHIVRDPRANAYSWLSQKEGFTSRGPWRTSLSWNARNYALELVGSRLGDRYLRVRYEDFVHSPKACIERILDHTGERDKDLSFIGEDGVAFGVNHCVYGNPDLFKSGKVKLRLDERWRKMARRDQLIASALTWPLKKRFGY